ncbi:hypothetical protein C2845_PM05G00070 [Panicum miliaceum]|uniref:Uncharacterized protein n=1 Tax=Panicum miliaceum TaxID=4540 RepID=A0A3L6T2B7_PANMI|nr:hypothetical protein C2845_PM05G00070 [Panicum miliaceum]
MHACQSTSPSRKFSSIDRLACLHRSIDQQQQQQEEEDTYGGFGCAASAASAAAAAADGGDEHDGAGGAAGPGAGLPGGDATGGGGLMLMGDNDSSAASTPRGSKSWRRSSWCRPAKEALEEAQAKGTLVDRIAFLEDRVLKMEEDMDIVTPEKMTTVSGYGHDDATCRDHRSSSSKKKGLKSFVKSCVRGKLKTKD